MSKFTTILACYKVRQALTVSCYTLHNLSNKHS